jgi:Spy/CpxP family protein refolding chaperone
MRIIMTLATGAALALSTAAAYAQAPSAQPPAAQQQAPDGAPTIQSVRVIDLDQLPEDTRKQVNDVVAQRGPEQQQKLRESIDATPEIKSALEAQGLTSAQVIVASLSQEGVLTLVTKKRAG